MGPIDSIFLIRNICKQGEQEALGEEGEEEEEEEEEEELSLEEMARDQGGVATPLPSQPCSVPLVC